MRENQKNDIDEETKTVDSEDRFAKQMDYGTTNEFSRRKAIITPRKPGLISQPLYSDSEAGKMKTEVFDVVYDQGVP